jgi:hypothetical protein
VAQRKLATGSFGRSPPAVRDYWPAPDDKCVRPTARNKSAEQSRATTEDHCARRPSTGDQSAGRSCRATTRDNGVRPSTGNEPKRDVTTDDDCARVRIGRIKLKSGGELRLLPRPELNEDAERLRQWTSHILFQHSELFGFACVAFWADGTSSSRICSNLTRGLTEDIMPALVADVLRRDISWHDADYIVRHFFDPGAS